MDIRRKPPVAAYILLSLLIAIAIWGTIGPPRLRGGPLRGVLHAR
jgi:hypothetical protein